MLKTICQIMISCVLMLSNQESAEQNPAAYMIECIEAECSSRIYYPIISGRTIESEETLLEVQEELEHLTTENIGIRIEDGNLDTSGLADGLASCWQQYQKKNYYVLSVDYTGEEEQGIDVMTPFLDRMEEECITVLEKELARKGGFPEYIKLERVRGLDVYTVCVNMSGSRASEREYIAVLNGVWEGQEVCWQTVTFPELAGYDMYYPFHNYFTAPLDINYDGHTDLFIREGYSGGTGGSWTNYRGIIWKEDSGEFIWYESFPSRVTSAEYLRQRMIKYYRLGAPEERVTEYKVVDGEYTVTRELVWITTFTYNEAGKLINTLSYYEMGVLVREHDVTDMTGDEIYALYPDLDYWQRG